MRLSKLSSVLTVQAAMSLAAQVAFAQPAVEASASKSSSKAASQAGAAVLSPERAPVQRWDGLDPQAIKRVSEGESKPKVPAFQAELK